MSKKKNKKEREEAKEFSKEDKVLEDLSQGGSEFDDLKVQNEEYLAGWKRALADYTNLQSNLVQEKGQMRASLKEEFVSSLLPVLDNFDQALRFKPEECAKDVEQWLMGVLHVKAQLESLIEQFDAKPFGQAGEMFDPALHTALSTREEEEKEDQEILEVQVRGWMIEEKVIRSANVIINNLTT
jgi:molecular chaperone GrpE